MIVAICVITYLIGGGISAGIWDRFYGEEAAFFGACFWPVALPLWACYHIGYWIAE